MTSQQSLANHSTEPTNSVSAKPGLAAYLQHSKVLVAIVAVLGVTVMALTAALVSNRSEAQSGDAATRSTAAMAPVAPISPTPLVAGVHPATSPNLTGKQPAQPRNNTATYASSRSSQHNAAAPTMNAPSSRAPVCTDCGTVQAVSAVQRQGQVNGVAVGNTTVGLGTVAGGVLGGLLGHQMGAGNGKTAMTVLGAAGGAYAGNAVEKNMHKVTVYAVQVRMDNGSTRHFEVSNAVAVGSKVVIEGKNLRLAPASNLAAG